MKLIIVSDRVGTPGDEYHVGECINVDALLEHGFIKQEQPKTSKAEDN